MHKKYNNQGFTLIEVIVVIVLVGLVVAYIAPQMLGRADDAKRKAAELQLQKVSNAIEVFKFEVGRYPSTLVELVRKPDQAPDWQGPYLQQKKQLLDPWQRQLSYRQPGEHGRFDLFSLGADGQPEGTGDAADITHWD